MKLHVHSHTTMAAPLKFGNGQVISSHTLLGMWLFIHLEIKVNLCGKCNPWCLHFYFESCLMGIGSSITSHGIGISYWTRPCCITIKHKLILESGKGTRNMSYGMKDDTPGRKILWNIILLELVPRECPGKYHIDGLVENVCNSYKRTMDISMA